MKKNIKKKVKVFLEMTFDIVNRLPDEEERKRIIFDLVDKLAPMNIIHHVEDTQAYNGIGFQSTDGIIVDHVALQFKTEESLEHAYKVIDNISNSERIKLLYGLREVVWDFHHLVKTMTEPFFGEENSNESPS